MQLLILIAIIMYVAIIKFTITKLIHYHSENTMKNLKGTLILLLTALIWGFAFVAQTSASDTVHAFTFNGSRSILATIFLFFVVLIQESSAKKKTGSSISILDKKTFIAGVACGIPLFIATNLQQYGIELYPEGTAASGRGGFLTATYVIMVALYSIIKSKKIKPFVIIATILCMIGMYFLCLSGGIGNLYLSDILIILCALAFAVYIIIVDKYADLNSAKVSMVQFTVAGVLSCICALIFEHPTCESLIIAIVPIAYAGIFSSGIAYTLQIVGQRYAEAAVATIVMSLESVFAALGGWLLLNEALSSRELIGCALVFASVLIAQFEPAKSK